MFSPSVSQEENGSSSDTDDDINDIEKSEILYSRLFTVTREYMYLEYRRPDRNGSLYSSKNNHEKDTLPIKVSPYSKHQTFCVYRE